MTRVTLSPKRYIYQCAGCGLLNHSFRKDTLTCNGACRVKAHRSGELHRLRKMAAEAQVEPASLLHAIAIDKLCPELYAPIMAGKLSLQGAMPQACAAFDRLLAEISSREANQQ
jgi:hypothetical protein